MKKLRKLKLLNASEQKVLFGGKQKCNESGDTIFCPPIGGSDIKLCMEFEGTCQSSFSSSCSMIKVTITCPASFTVKPDF